MNNLIFFTDNLVDTKEFFNMLTKTRKRVLLSKDLTYISGGKFPYTFYLDFETEREKESYEPLTDDFRKKIPLSNPYCILVDLHMYTTTKMLVKVLKQLAPELYVYDNQENWFGTADEFLKKLIFVGVSNIRINKKTRF